MGDRRRTIEEELHKMRRVSVIVPEVSLLSEDEYFEDLTGKSLTSYMLTASPSIATAISYLLRFLEAANPYTSPTWIFPLDASSGRGN